MIDIDSLVFVVVHSVSAVPSSGSSELQVFVSNFLTSLSAGGANHKGGNW